MGTKEGSRKAVASILAKDPDFFKKIGRKGGRVSTPHGGFGYSHEHAVECGLKGGTISRRTGVKNGYKRLSDGTVVKRENIKEER